MSRSFRKTPICGITTCSTEKRDKRLYNRRLRRINKLIINRDMDDAICKIVKEICDLWSMHKDGRQRFDPMEFPIMMRK